MRLIRHTAAAVALSGFLAAAVPAWSSTTELEAEAGAGSCGGSISCAQTLDKILYDPAAATALTAAEHPTSLAA
jgi:hypothetical protein